MKLSSDHVMKTAENERRYEAMRYDVIDVHLFDENMRLDEALCGAQDSHNVRSVKYYLEDRVHGPSVSNVCRECKVLAVPLAGEIIEAAIEEHEAKGRFDVAEDYLGLASALTRETGQNQPGG